MAKFSCKKAIMEWFKQQLVSVSSCTFVTHEVQNLSDWIWYAFEIRYSAGTIDRKFRELRQHPLGSLWKEYGIEIEEVDNKLSNEKIFRIRRINNGEVH